MKKTLLLVFVHGFKGDDTTFKKFPQDLCALLSHTLPNIDVISVQYPKYETRGDLNECVSRFKEWLQNKVIDLEVANGTPSPTVDPSVHVVLCGHSMGGIVAAETLLSLARDTSIPSSDISSTPNDSTQTNSDPATPELPSQTPAPLEPPGFVFPYIRAILAFDTPYLGISPGVLAHGAEEHYQHASTAFKAYDTASNIFGWNKAAQSGAAAAGAGVAATAAANDSGRASPNTSKWGKWGRYAMVGGAAAAAVAGVAGAAYLNWNQINEGLTWAGSHLEFVGCLARGAELKQRVERIIGLTETHDLGFADFYSALGQKVTSKTRYAGAVMGEDRTFCVVPKQGGSAGMKRGSPPGMRSPGEQPAVKRPDADGRNRTEEQQMEEGRQVRDYAKDTTKNKGRWVRCVNDHVADEISAHRAMFSPDTNPDYHSMVPRARDQIYEWVDMAWYENSVRENQQTADGHPSLI